MPAAAHNFPHQPTPFNAREGELSAILSLRADPNYRLLTLIGPSAVGKTRLEVEAAISMAEDLERGSYFINLELIREPNHIVSAIADVLNAGLSALEEIQIQLRPAL